MDAKEVLRQLGGHRKGRKPKGLPKRTGKHHDKYVRAYAKRSDRKLRRILKRNGESAAKSWAHQNDAQDVLLHILNQRR